MPSILPINVEDLLRGHGVESSRLELKASWDEVTTGAQVIKTICAFANDLQNLNGGYIVLGVAEQDGVAELPPLGLPKRRLDAIQRWIRGQCKRLDPEYQPVLSPETLDGRDLLVVWAPGSETRPHRAPGSNDRQAPKHYYIRLGNETVDARDEHLRTLMQLTARVPFDDRRAHAVPVEKIREAKVKEFLRDVRSALADEGDARLVYRRMFIVSPVNGHEVPRNIGLLFFSDDPEEWFRGARIEVVHFAEGAGGDVLEERVFRGPLHTQLRDCLGHLRNLSTRHIEKQADRPDTKGWVSYPLAAFEEAIVNAVYHRSYEDSVEPTKVYLHPDRMEIISYPGPVPGINAEHLKPGARLPPVPARNRRIGEFLKELRLAEGRGTGLPKLFKAMRENGSPSPTFDFDDSRTYFRVTLPAHPEYRAVAALRDAAQLRALGRKDAALKRIVDAFDRDPGSGALATALMQAHAQNGNTDKVLDVYRAFFAQPERDHEFEVLRACLSVHGIRPDAPLDSRPRIDDATLIDVSRRFASYAERFIDDIEKFDAMKQAASRERPDVVHEMLSNATELVRRSPAMLLLLAESKIELAQSRGPDHEGDRFDDEARRRLLVEARDALRRVTQMNTSAQAQYIAWHLLASVLEALEAPETEITAARKESDAFELKSKESAG